MKKLICVLSVIMTLAACQKDITKVEPREEITSAANDRGKPVLNIGDAYQGGIVAYILQPGDPGYKKGKPHGLIATEADFNVSAYWGCYETTIKGADGFVLGTGNQNTIDIVNGCFDAGIAARLCAELVLGGYSDWYLPSMRELQKLAMNRDLIGDFYLAFGNYYWSSTESTDAGFAVAVDMLDGEPIPYNKTGTGLNVRAIRSF